MPVTDLPGSDDKSRVTDIDNVDDVSVDFINAHRKLYQDLHEEG